MMMITRIGGSPTPAYKLATKIAQAPTEPEGNSGGGGTALRPVGGNTPLTLPDSSPPLPPTTIIEDGHGDRYGESGSSTTLINPRLPNVRVRYQQNRIENNVTGIISDTTDLNVGVTAREGTVTAGSRNTKIDRTQVPLNIVALPEGGKLKDLKFTTVKDGKELILYFAGTSLSTKLVERMKQAGELEIDDKDVYKTGDGQYTVKLRFKNPDEMISVKFTTQKPSN